MIDGSTKIYGIFGYPIKHTLSPLMHNAAFESLNLNAAYLPFEVRPEELKRAVESIRALGICGLNITIPHKERIIPFLDELSPEAESIGAVNTIVVGNRRLTGYNTDGIGFMVALRKDLEISPKGKDIFILGAGGAARAISFVLAKEGVNSIILFDLIKSRTQGLAKDLRKNFPQCLVKAIYSPIDHLTLSNINILINATPVGMNKDDPLVFDPKLLHSKLIVCDLIYNPLETKLLSIAKRKCLKTMNGIGMLLYQGALSFQLWTGRRAPIEVMRKALYSGVGRKIQC